MRSLIAFGLIFLFQQILFSQETSSKTQVKVRKSEQTITLLSRIEHDNRITLFYRVGHENFIHWKKVLDRFKTKQGVIEVHPHLKMLMISDTKKNIPHLQNVIQTLATPQPQVKITAKIVEIKWTRDFEIGLEGDPTAGSAMYIKNLPTEAFLREIIIKLNPSSALISPFMGTTFRFYSFSSHRGTIAGILQMFLETGKADLIATPVITVENHKTAEILLEDKLPVPKQTLTPSGIVTAITYETIKTSLKITPSVINNKLVKLHIQTSFGLLVGRQVIAGLEAPIISNRRANTLVTLPSEGEIFIGGITRKDRVQVRRGIPFLMDIPIIGALFSKYEEEEGKAEIFFYIKVEIFPPQKPPTRTSESETKK